MFDARKRRRWFQRVVLGVAATAVAVVAAPAPATYGIHATNAVHTIGESSEELTFQDIASGMGPCAGKAALWGLNRQYDGALQVGQFTTGALTGFLVASGTASVTSNPILKWGEGGGFNVPNGTVGPVASVSTLGPVAGETCSTIVTHPNVVNTTITGSGTYLGGAATFECTSAGLYTGSYSRTGTLGGALNSLNIDNLTFTFPGSTCRIARAGNPVLGNPLVTTITYMLVQTGVGLAGSATGSISFT